MKKIKYFSIIYFSILTSTCAILPSQGQSSELTDYAKMPKTREAVAQAIAESESDCIDNVIGLLSTLEQEQNSRQAAQQDATACKLELEDLKDKNKRKEKKSKPKEVEEYIRTIKKLEDELKASDERVTIERGETEKALAEIKELKKSLDINQRENIDLKKFNNLLTNDLTKQDETVRELNSQLNQLGQKERENRDLQAALFNERAEWKEEKNRLLEQISGHQAVAKDQTQLTSKITELEQLLAKAQETSNRIPALETELQKAQTKAQQAERESLDSKALKEEADKKMAELEKQLEVLKRQNEKSAAQELEQTQKREKNAALRATIAQQVDTLIGQLDKIQELLPA